MVQKDLCQAVMPSVARRNDPSFEAPTSQDRFYEGAPPALHRFLPGDDAWSQRFAADSLNSDLFKKPLPLAVDHDAMGMKCLVADNVEEKTGRPMYMVSTLLDSAGWPPSRPQLAP